MSSAVDFAQRRICRIMRARPQDLCACLPFDPLDPLDVRIWVETYFSCRRSLEDKGFKYAAQRAIWVAQKTGRRKSRCCSIEDEHISNAHNVFVATPQVADRRLASEAVEAVLMSTIASARTVFVRHGKTRRAAKTILGCLARIVYSVWEAMSQEIAVDFLSDMSSQGMFRTLGIGESEQRKFIDSMMSISITGNMRRDLAAARLSAPGSRQWAEFERELTAQWNDRSI